MDAIRQFFRNYLIADAAPLSSAERWRSALAGLLGYLMLEALLTVLPVAPETRRLLAPTGASAVILFCLPHSPLGQPWSIAGGLLLPAAIGLACGHWIALPWLALALAVAASIWAMAALRCLHPPGGAMAVMMTGIAQASSAGWTPLLAVAANVLGLLLAAMLINNLIRGRSYPQCAAVTQGNKAPPAPLPRDGIEHQDLSYALEQMDSYLDISEKDLVAVYNLAMESAFRRHTTTTCADLMTRDVVAIDFATGLEEAWQLLRSHHIKALPVLDRARRVIGLLTLDDFLKHVPVKEQPVAERIRQFLQPTPASHSDKHEVAGQIMSERFITVRENDDIARVAALLGSRHHPHAIPVVDAQGKLAGILSQTDVVAALYHHQATGRVTQELASNAA